MFMATADESKTIDARCLGSRDEITLTRAARTGQLVYECIASHHIALRVLERCAVFESNDAYADAYCCHEADLMPDKFLKSPDAPLEQRAREASCLLRKQLHGGKRGPRAVVTFRIERVLDSMRELLIDAGLLREDDEARPPSPLAEKRPLQEERKEDKELFGVDVENELYGR